MTQKTTSEVFSLYFPYLGIYKEIKWKIYCIFHKLYLFLTKLANILIFLKYDHDSNHDSILVFKTMTQTQAHKKVTLF